MSNSHLSAIDDALLAALLSQDGFELPAGAGSMAPRAPLSLVVATPAQQRMWTVARIDGASSEFNLGLTIRFDAPLDVPALARALLALVGRHEALRVRFADRDGTLEQHFDALPALPLARHACAAAQLDALLQGAGARLFDLEEGRLVRADLFEPDGGAAVLLLGFHHIMIDRWSAAIVLRELTALYASECGASLASLAPAPQFGDYAMWLRAPAQLAAQAALRQYWGARLAHLPPTLDLPFSGARGQAGMTLCERIPLALGPTLTAAIARLAAERHSTPFMVLLASLNAVLMRFSGAEDIAVGTPLANRHRPGSEQVLGLLADTLVLRSDLRGDPSFGTLLERVRDATVADFRHQDLAFDEQVQLVNPARRKGVTPLFQSMFVFQAMAPLRAEAGGVGASASALPLPMARADLVLELDSGLDDIAGALEYRRGLIEPAIGAAIARALPVLLEAGVAAPDTPLSALPLQEAGAAQAWLAARQAPPPVPFSRSLSAAFVLRARLTPDAVALIEGERVMRFAELEQESARMAAHLRTLGVAAGVPVALCLPGSIELAVAILAVLRAGGAFLPLDPAFPAARLASMLRECGARHLVCHGAPPWLPDDAQLTLIAPGQAWPPAPAPEECNGPDSVAYILYTSGSTGQPKAVMGLHQGALNRIAWMHARYPFEASEVCCLKTAPTFVDFIWEFFGPLLAGVSSVILPRAVVIDPHALARALERHRVSRLVLVPSLLAALLEHVSDLGVALKTLRHCTCSGEALTADLVARCLALLPGCRLLNLYGSSEVSADSTFFEVDPAHQGAVPIGWPIPGNLVAVLDRAGHILPVGAAGQIVIGGIGLARGYLGGDGDTPGAERFVALPDGIAGGRGFRSGDLGRWRPDGGLDYLGRLDRQLKIRGVRIDPAEVRAALMRHPAIRDVAIVARALHGGEPGLVAYVVGVVGADPLAQDSLRRWAADTLPAALRPAVYIGLAHLPLNANGKVDLAALPWGAELVDQAIELAEAASEADTDATPLSLDEALLADAWQQILGQRPNGPQANFFLLGGHSLSAVRLAAAIEQRCGVRLPVAEVFEAPTLRAMAAQIRAAAPAARLPALVVGGPRHGARASFNQERLWLIEQQDGLGGAYNQAIAYRLRGALDADRLQRALDALVRRHEALRTRLVLRDGQLWQAIDAAASCGMRRLDLRAAPDAGQAADALLREEAQRPFALEREWPLRATLIALDEQDAILALVLHHSASDGWSGQLIVEQLRQSYAGADLAGLAPPAQQADFSDWQRACLEQGACAPQLDYWRSELKGAPATLGLLLSALPEPRDYRLGQVALHLAPACVAQLRLVAGAAQASLFALLLGLWGALLARFGDEQEVVIGIPVTGRSQGALDGAVGFLSNTLPLRIDCGGAVALGELTRRVQRRVLAGLQHQDVSLAHILEVADLERVPQRAPLFQAMFVLSETAPWELALEGVTSTMLDLPAGLARSDLTLALRERGGAIDGQLEFAADVIAPALAGRLAAAFLRLLEGALAQPTLPLMAQPLLAAEQVATLARFARAPGAPEEPQAATRLHQLAQRSAAHRPEALAVMTPDGAINYRQLARHARRYARAIVAAGVRPGDRVALIAERSIALIVALLGVSEAGAVYVPIDPAYPRAGIEAMLADAGVVAIVSDASALWAASETIALPLPALADDDDRDDGAAWLAAGADDAAACIIFTSGSSGRPKGVIVGHRALCRLALSACSEFSIEADSRILQLAAFGFDVATSDIVFALAAGACLCLAPRTEILPGSPLLRTLGALAISHLQIPASLLAATRPEPLPCLRTLVVGGERLPAKVAQAWGAGRALFVAYGPTEATVTVTAARYDPRAPDAIGRPIGDARIHVLDAGGAPVPIGVPGQLWIGGPVLSAGYLNNPGLTAERFQADPFSAEPGARLYRSGDRAAWREDGALDFLGRLDRQFKLRGFRIEPGEIEAALLAWPAVEQALALLRSDAPGQSRLVGYVVAAGALDMAALRAHLRRLLPVHMVPAALVQLARMPLSANGKLDARALPAPELDGPAAGPGADTPQDAAIERVGVLWRQILGLARIDPDANFFDVGGHSLLLVELHDLLGQAFEAPVPISDLFRFPTIRALAAHLTQAGCVAEAAPVIAAQAADAPIAVIGMACRFPGAPDLAAFWQMLLDGREGIRRLDEADLAAAGRAPELLDEAGFVAAGGVIEDADCFDAGFFGLGPRDALTLDPQHRLALECAWHALEHAGYAGATADAAVGVFVGVGVNTYLRGALFPDGALPEGADAYHAMTGNDKDFAASRIAYHLDLKGPALAVQSACSSSLLALDLACQALRNGRAGMALAGGVAVRFPQSGGYRHEAGMILSRDGHCKAFAADASGTVPGGGVGMVLLKPLARALVDGDRVLAVVRGSAINNDGARKVGYAAPGVDGQADVIAQALRAAHLAPDAIDYIEAHGTGTELGYPVEAAALTRVFQGRARPLALGTVKSNIGHADAAAGIAGLIKTVLAIQHGVLPPSLHFEAANPRIDFEAAQLRVPVAAQSWPATGQPRRAGVSAFGIGGTNVHVVLEQAPPEPASVPASALAQVLTLSARSEASLAAGALALAEALEREPGLALADVAFTLQTGRAALVRRAACVADTPAAAAACLRRLASAGQWGVAGAPRVALLFPGQGSQYPGMGRAQYENDAVYRYWFERCAVALAPHLEGDLRELLYGAASLAADEAALTQTGLAQPALFCVMYALARSVLAHGIEPVAMLGHSLGEYVAACLAEVFDLDTALALVAARGRLMQALPGGAMLAVQIGAGEADALLRAWPDGQLSLAAVNGAGQCVFSGSDAAIEALQAQLGGARAALRLATSHAFHSPMMEPIGAQLLAQLAAIELRPPKRRFISNVSGSWISDAEATDPAYWVRHACQPVRFDDGLTALRGAGVTVLLELGPGAALRKLALGAGWPADHLPALGWRRAAPEQPEQPQALLAALAQMWTLGVPVDWQRSADLSAEARAARRVALPAYAFERCRHWPAPRAVPASGATPLAGRAEPADWFYLPGWQRAPALAASVPARQSWLLFGVEHAPGAALYAALRGAGEHVTGVLAGTAYATLADGRRVIDPAQDSHYRRLLDELEQDAHRPERIVHLWTARLDSDSDSDSALEAMLARGFYSVMRLAQAVGAQGIVRPLRLDLVSPAIADITGAETVCAAAAPLLGAAKVIPLEYPNIDCRLIDIGAGDCALPDALRDGGAGPVLALRNGRRWLPQLSRVRLERPVEAGGRLRAGGVYLITGAFGGMGAVLARDLAARHQARLVLLGRHVDAELVAALEGAGAQVLAQACDIADAPALGALIAAARARFGAIDGVFHAAGVADLGGVIQNRDLASMAAVLTPKVQGSLALAGLFDAAPLDFMVLFSTLGALLPQAKFGQVAYAAANEFLDAYAAERSARTGQWTVAINWDDWAETGMTLKAYRRWGKAAPPPGEALSCREGLDVLYRILAAPHARVAVSVRDLPALMADAHRLLDGHGAPPASPAGQTDMHGDLGDMSETEATLAESWRQILGVAHIGRQANFFELGGHSLIAMRLLAFVRERFGVPLNIAAIFEHATLAALASHIDRARPSDAQIEEFLV
ncbi:amino acid adenylation domain-containing protein [Oxalobacteraceae bacterium GrIS 1.11]